MARGCATVNEAQNVLDKRKALDIRDKEDVYTISRTRSAARTRDEAEAADSPRPVASGNAPFFALVDATSAHKLADGGGW